MDIINYFQIEILLGKTENFDKLMAAAAEEADVGEDQEQSWNGGFSFLGRFLGVITDLLRGVYLFISSQKSTDIFCKPVNVQIFLHPFLLE